MDIELLVKITSRAWALEILAQLHAGVAARQAPLLAKIGAGRTAFAASLGHLIEIGLLERNPGHGHPLRPEYRLTARGEVAAKLAFEVLQRSGGEAPMLRRAWRLPVLRLVAEPQRFSAIKSGLPGITDRALTKTLVDLEDATWISRDFDMSARRPFPIYQAVGKGAAVAQAMSLY